MRKKKGGINILNLVDENKRLNETILQQEKLIKSLTIKALRGRKPLGQETINKIIELRDKGKKYNEIEKILSVSRPVIAKYLKMYGRIQK